MPQTQQAFLLIAAKQQPGRVDDLLSFLKPEERQELAHVFETLKKHPPKTVQKVVAHELNKIAHTRRSNYLADVHDDWLVEILLSESPAMIATILRYLPAERVRAILHSLPRAILDELPRMGDTYQVTPALVDVLRTRFESQFLQPKEIDPQQQFVFEHFCVLRGKQIADVFLEMGFREIALGLVALPDEARKLVTDRLSRADRQRVEFYINNNKTMPEQRVKRAQSQLLSYQPKPGSGEHFVRDLGFLLFSKALLLRDRADLQIIQRKMSQADAATLQRYVDKMIDGNSEASVVAYREDVLAAVKRVLEKR